MQYVFRYQDRRQASKPRFWTVPTDGIEVSFKERFRRTGGGIPGLGQFSEHAGFDKSTVVIKSKKDLTTRSRLPMSSDARGVRHSINTLVFRLLERNQYVRSLRPEDEDLLADYDRQIREIQDRLATVKNERAGHVAEIWKRSEKVNINDLEEKANAG